MKNSFTIIRYIILNIMVFVIALPMAMSQAPSHLPRRKPEPIGFFDSIENTIIFVVIPVLIIILYFIWKKNQAKLAKETEEAKEN
jgi:SNF family Na+-dependent transporter